MHDVAFGDDSLVAVKSGEDTFVGHASKQAPGLLDFNENSLARRKCEMMEPVGVGDQDDALTARPRDDGRAREF